MQEKVGEKIMKRFRENILFMLIGTLISITFSYVLAESIINSKDVYYEDKSGLAVNNVQDAIDGTCTKFNNNLTNLKKELLNQMYPVGSVYISATLSTADQVKNALGGTWEVYGKGQTLVGVDTSQTEFNTIGKTGGAKSVSYTPGGTVGNTTLTTDQIPSHTHTISHTHTTPQTNTTTLSLTAQSNGAHTHNLNVIGNPTPITGHPYNQPSSYSFYFDASGSNAGVTVSAGAHTHSVTGTVTVPAMTTNSISTSTSGATGGGKAHTHTFTGTATTISTLQPYVTVYMYKRTA